MSGTVKVHQTITPTDPFSGRRLGPPRHHVEHVPTEVDHEPVPSGTPAEILDWVDGSGERARAATMAELQRSDGPRPSLIRKLEVI